MSERIAFIGGGNMASAIIGGMIKHGVSPQNIEVVEPSEDARSQLHSSFGITAQAQPSDALTGAGLVVWAVKPQTFKEAALAVAPFTADALHLSVAAGITTDSLAAWLGSDRVVRAMPNTPALVGKGISGLFARAGVCAEDQQRVEQGLCVLFHRSHDPGRCRNGPGA